MSKAEWIKKHVLRRIGCSSLHKIGIDFSTDTRRIDDWRIEE